MSEQAVQVQQKSVSTSETAESTIESTVEEQSKVSDETVESTDTNSEVQVDKPGTVNIDKENIKTQIQEVSSALSLDDTSFTLYKQLSLIET